MDLRVKATDYKLTPEASDYLDGRLSTLEKFLGDNPELVRCEVELGRAAGRPKHGKNLWFAEMSIVRPGRDRIYARNNAESVNAAIDDVKEEVERQLLRDRQLHRRVFRKGGAMLKNIMRFGRE
ncbi:MAG: HPF/RaiA family ribosome-associated protein [bacterium]|nr:HPF/RaiA family ribosome-associated protein [bacterium]